MRTYNKRIGFLVSSQTLVPHGGIGQFTKSFCELMHTHGYKVDIITDKSPRGTNDEFIKQIGTDLIYPDSPLPYTEHSEIFMYEDSYCYERMANFRNAIIKALSNNMYDIFVCNTYESVQVASALGLSNFIQMIAYTHLESQIFQQTYMNPFLDEVNEMMRKQLDLSSITVGTQSKFNQSKIFGSHHLPIPLPEKSLLKEYHKPREGVLFIGRWEKGKNHETYIDLIQQTKLPARVMTSASSANKFEERLKKIGVDYKIVSGMTGQDKVDFITDCRVAFNPSLVESYGIAFLEQMIQMPTFALKDQRWTENFDSRFFFVTDKKNMAKDISDAYSTFDTADKWYEKKSIAYFSELESKVFYKWNQCFLDFTRKQSNNTNAKICQEHTVKYADFIAKLGRDLICIDDIRSVLSNSHKFRIIYTDQDTYLTKDPAFEPKEEISALSLFEGI